jgi:NAD-dependent dihydropyrimidine dehydrogenase PreA subunit
MARKEMPQIDESRCTGCEDCAVVCPTECLEIWQGYPVVVRPVDCVSCTVCESVCPWDAIAMGWEVY